MPGLYEYEYYTVFMILSILAVIVRLLRYTGIFQLLAPIVYIIWSLDLSGACIVGFLL